MPRSGQNTNSPLPARAELLLTRDAFREGVFARDRYKCVVCGEPAVDAHHLIERRLWDDGGYYLSNGVSLCSEHHLAAEQTLLSVEDLREAAGIRKVLLPSHLEAGELYDKWGNLIGPDGRRYPGELFHEESVQKVLRDGGIIDLFDRRMKHPRTAHLAWSPGRSADDIELAELDAFVGREVVISEKLDGEATTFGRDYCHARSLDSSYHPTRTWVRKLAADVGWQLPEGWRVSGENLQGVHTIRYRSLPSYFFVYGISDDRHEYLSYDETCEWVDLLGLQMVPLLYRGVWDEEKTKACFTGRSVFDCEQEGYVVRLADRFPYSDYRRAVAKYVRAGHVADDAGHWASREPEFNELAV